MVKGNNILKRKIFASSSNNNRIVTIIGRMFSGGQMQKTV